MDDVNPADREDFDLGTPPPVENWSRFDEWWASRPPPTRSPTPSEEDVESLPPPSPRPSSPDNNDEEEQDVDDAPIFHDVLTRDQIYDHEDDEDNEDNEEHLPGPSSLDEIPGLPSAFYEHPILRNIYIGVFINAAFNHSTHEAVKIELETHYRTLKSCERYGDMEIPGLDKMARTLRSVERRLNVHADRFIHYYFLCPLCWQLHRPEQLATLSSPICTREFCEGIIYQERRLSGQIKRVPMKIMPVTPLIPQIQRILLREGKVEELQHWRRPGDEPGLAPPVPADEWHVDPDRPLTDISDGSGWREVRAGLQRQCTGEPGWHLEDADVLNLNQRFVSLKLGLMLIINIDWYV